MACSIPNLVEAMAGWQTGVQLHEQGALRRPVAVRWKLLRALEIYRIIAYLSSFDFLSCVIPPNALFFSFAQGIPTHDASGKELSSSQIKKLKKLYTVQEKNYNKIMSETKNGN